ncbi:hypothetical protein OROHE_024131 [Orobanche hederae]
MNDQAMMVNQNQQQPLMYMKLNQSFMSMMNQMNPHQQHQQQMFQAKRSHEMRPPPQLFRNPNSKPGSTIPPPPASHKSLAPRKNWKGKKINNKPVDKRMMKMDQKKSLIPGADVTSGRGGNLNLNSFNDRMIELQHKNQLKTRNLFPRRKSDNMNISGGRRRSAPLAPRNATSIIIRSKRSGGIAPLIHPSPVTPSVLPTPKLSPLNELLVDMAKEEWGVDGYGSMNGLIRLRSPPEQETDGDLEDDDGGGSSGGHVEEHVEMERRLDHDLSRFEMIYNPNYRAANDNNGLENRVGDRYSHIARLEEESLVFKERLFFMERELGDLRKRMLCLERMGDSGEECNSLEEDNEDFNGENVEGDDDNNNNNNNSNNNNNNVESKEENNVNDNV